MFKPIHVVMIIATITFVTISGLTPIYPNTTYSFKSPSKMKIIIGKKSFDAVLFNNPTSDNFKKMLPLTLTMQELNGNEKYAELHKKVNVNPTNPGQINIGDLMMYGSSTLVLFYKSFPTSYSYTPVGRIEDVSGLQEAVGNKNVSVLFELK